MTRKYIKKWQSGPCSFIYTRSTKDRRKGDKCLRKGRKVIKILFNGQRIEETFRCYRHSHIGENQDLEAVKWILDQLLNLKKGQILDDKFTEAVISKQNELKLIQTNLFHLLSHNL